MSIKHPSPVTLAKYGLTLDEWLAYLPKRRGKYYCRICKKEKDQFVTDHEHVRGWQDMPPERRKLYVRGVVCGGCNYYVLTKQQTADKHRNAAKYLDEYAKRRP